MREVSKDEFYGPIFRDRLNVHPFIQSGPWPYTSIWRHPSQHGAAYGKTVDRVEGGCAVTAYFLNA